MNALTQNMIKTALQEDTFDKDITSSSIVDSRFETSASFIVKTSGIFCGSELLIEVYRQINPKLEVTICKEDGEFVSRGDCVASIKGRMLDILKGERVALNVIERISGVATLTDRFVEEVQGTNAIIEASRDTTPGFREAEYQAIETVGAVVSRNNLSDHIVITRCHIYASKTIEEAVLRVRKKHPDTIVEVEVENQDEYLEAINTDCNAIILHDMTNDAMKEVLSLPSKGKTIKASGNMSIGRVRSVAKLGIDYIIINCLSNYAKGLDMRLKFMKLTFK